MIIRPSVAAILLPERPLAFASPARSTAPSTPLVPAPAAPPAEAASDSVSIDRLGASVSRAAVTPETAAQVARLAADARVAGSLVSLPTLAGAMVAAGASAEERVALGLAALEQLARIPETAAAAALGLHAIQAAARGPAEERVAAIQTVLDHARATSLQDLAGLGLEIGQAIPLVGSGEANHVVLETLQARPEADALKLAWSALERYPTNLMSHTYAVRHALEAPAARGADLAKVGGEIYHEAGMRGDCYTAVPMARKYVEALQCDPEVGTAMWFARSACDGLPGFENLQAYVLDATFAHPGAQTGAELSAIGLEALEAVPEGCPKPAARLAGSVLRALRGLYSDGESRRVVDEALAGTDRAVATSMAFGGGGDTFQNGRDIAHAALLKLRGTEDATTRLRRAVEQVPAHRAGGVEHQEGNVIIGGVRVPKRATSDA